MVNFTKHLRGILLGTLAAAGLGIVGFLVLGVTVGPQPEGAYMTTAETPADKPVRHQLLESLLQESNPARWSELYIRHGAPVAEEVPVLAEKARSSSSQVRRNAARLLALSFTPESKAALHKVVAETSDPQVFGRALGGLLDEPDAKTVAAARPPMLQQALHSDDSEAAGAAVRATHLLGLPDADLELGRRLYDPDFHVRMSTMETLAVQGAGALEPKLRELLLTDVANKLYPSKSNLYAALAQSTDPQTAEVLQQSLKGANTERVLDFSNGLLLSHSRQPWLRKLLLAISAQEGHPARWQALDRLWDWNDPSLQEELGRLCLAQLDKRLPKERSDALINDFELDACVAKLNKLLGHEYTFRQLFELRDAARARFQTPTAAP